MAETIVGECRLEIMGDCSPIILYGATLLPFVRT
jgi:hypothetical protein